MLSQQVPIDSVPRRILPQQVGGIQQNMSINLSPTDLGGPRENHRNYVFVDEHNRHKRLKVMRACEGCRRRKIKCDAATTNTWPCSACVRLKLHCVPPMVQYDREYGPNQLVIDQEHHTQQHHVDFGGSSPTTEEELMHGSMMRKVSRASISSFSRGSNGYRTLSPHEAQHAQSHPHSAPLPYSTLPAGESIEAPLSNVQFHTPVYQGPQVMLRQQEHWQAPPDNDLTAELVGQLKIDDTGVASYISAQSRRLAETPAYESWGDEAEPNNPSFMPGQHEFAVKIRPEDMPPEHEALEMINIFFNHCHPYLPIVNKAAFFRQWETAREQISPLLLEAMFGCAGRLTNDPARGLKWTAMATRHMDCFFDVPRLSTVQALLLLLKARESAPQRGYFFRSWMSLVNIIAMAQDLGLDRHHEHHKQGVACGESPLECMTRARVWQGCFSYELMISAPQGRENMRVNPDSVDTSLPVRSNDLDDQEVLIHQQFIHMIVLQKSIRRMVDVHARLKASPTWRNDPHFMRSGPDLDGWICELPSHLQIRVNTDLTQPPPRIESHFAGNLQVYYHLARMMLHRPALRNDKSFGAGGEWRSHMSICTNAAKSICRLEEVLFEEYGMLGMQCMSRGVNFSIYCLLSGAMIHLIAATCPDPVFNCDAKDYFTRTMRLLESCIDNSASAEVKGQIEILREAFSVDTNRPFVLNPSFPFYSGVSAPVDPSLARVAYTQADSVPSTMAASSQVYTTQPLSPPHSAGGDGETKGESPAAVQSLVMLAAGNGAQQAPPPPQHMVEQLHWNPSRLFDNWNQAFGVNGSVTAAMPTGHETGIVESIGGGHPPSSSSYVPATSVGIPNSLISPGMWQDSVAAATVFSDSHKRPFPFGGENAWNVASTHASSAARTTTATATDAIATTLRADSGAVSRAH